MGDRTPYEAAMRDRIGDAARSLSNVAGAVPPEVIERRAESLLRLARRLTRATATR